ncbi:cell division protein FtsZ [Wenxinia marina]|uniref:Cell division protein FtsZ n=1 Tax=Wenxinia marina DSM 24838 TaxID=1123501 RepID=A0A0D0PAV4_9RHOB|nr:cell division protein FtsZ [Wenxinia marina]KIQ68586.1 cell division protein FtsZ [Wenxinia marina DSM 24838]GGL67080.1 cell division protein FtsZ [Wenxinia marina]
MTLNLSLPGQDDLKPRITVFGVGGAGGNAVNNMIEKQLDGVEFVVANTDAQALQQSMATSRIQMGVKVTEGLGAGARASVGAAAAEESIEQIVDHLAGAHMCFITAGMGGGTGTGAAPIIAQAARELGVLTVGVVTKPFQFEGAKRMKQAEDGVDALQKVVDTLIIIPNQNLFRLANERTTFTEAFALADDVLYQGVKGVTDLMVRPGLINLDFADVRAVMDEMGKAMMGTGEAEGDNRAVEAAEKAIANPLLDEISLEGAKGVLINITGGHDLTLFELDEAANKIREKVDPDANIIVGSTLDAGMEGMMRVSVVATGIDAVKKTDEVPLPRRSMARPLRETVSVEDEAPAQREPVRADRPAPAARPAPQPAPRAAERPAPQPVARMEEVEPEEEPNLFDASQFSVADGHDEYAGFDAAADEGEEDGLPAPAYQPRAEAPMSHSPESFVAPRAPAATAPGQPSPEALARLRAATQRQPEAAPARSEAPRPAAGAGAGQGEPRPRFGFNSLIGRMTGAQAEQAEQPRQQPPVRQQAQPVAEEDPDQERIEIPAFLRRQAN